MASFSVFEHKDGRRLTCCVWAKGVDSLLPVTQKVAFVKGQGIPAVFADWSRVMETFGDLMEQTGTDREISANFDRQASTTNSVLFLGLSPPKANKTVSFFVSFHRGATHCGSLFLVSIARATARWTYHCRPWPSDVSLLKGAPSGFLARPGCGARRCRRAEAGNASTRIYFGVSVRRANFGRPKPSSRSVAALAAGRQSCGTRPPVRLSAVPKPPNFKPQIKKANNPTTSPQPKTTSIRVH